MKTNIRPLAPLLVLAVAVPVLSQADDKPAPKPETAGKKEMRVIVSRHGDANVEKEPTTFLGVSTERASATLIEQLGLPQGMGLVVSAIVPDSPAAGVLKRHDVLLKLNDQLLIDSNQLAVLVRSFKEGDEITLTYVRGGKEATAKVKLAQRDLPKLSLLGRGMDPEEFGWRFFAPDAEGVNQVRSHLRRLDELPRAEVDSLLEMVDREPWPRGGAFEFHASGAPPVARILAMGQGNIKFNDDDGSLELKVGGGKKSLTAKDRAGKVLFEGPINTTEERASVPEGVRARLERLELIDTLQFRTDDDFEGGEVNVVTPRPKTISVRRLAPGQPASLPQPMRTPAPPVL